MSFAILAVALVTALAVIVVPITIGVSLRRRLDRSSDRIGSAMTDVGTTLQRLLEEQERANRRLENLEAIVTSEDWDQIRALQDERPSLDIPDEHAPEKEAERIARRVR